MKKLILFFALCGAGIPAQAQVSLGVKGGLTIPNITPGGASNPLSEGYSSFLTGGGGVFAEFQMTERFSLQAGLEFSQQGGQKNGMQALPAADVLTPLAAQIGAQPGGAVLTGLLPQDKYLYADFKSTAKFNYLMVPVQARLGWNLSKTSPVRFYVSAGLFGAYLCSAERVSTGDSGFFIKNEATYTGLGDYVAGGLSAIPGLPAGTAEGAKQMIDASARLTDNKQDITDEIKAFNFGFVGGVGFSYQLCERHRVFIEGGGNYGFLKIQKSAENGQNRIGAGSVMAGYSFTL